MMRVVLNVALLLTVDLYISFKRHLGPTLFHILHSEFRFICLFFCVDAGLDNIVALLDGRRYYLRVELPDGSKYPTDDFALYDNFQVASAADLYTLTSVGTFCSSGIGKRPIL